MKQPTGKNFMLKAFNQTQEDIARYINPEAIYLPPGYRVEVFAYGLDAPIGMVFSSSGDIYIAQSGISSGNPNILRLSGEHVEIVAEDFHTPVSGISYLDGNLYISHKGYITVLRADGTRENVISGLPCNGDFTVSNIAFGPEGKIYFGIGTTTNSGIVGEDNPWVYDHPLLHDVPPFQIVLNGQNFVTRNFLSNHEEEVAYTGAFSAFGEANSLYETRKGVLKASGCIFRSNRDGTKLEQVAWGLRNPLYLKFDRSFQLFASNRGYDNRGSRPIANAPDEFQLILPETWYGWPDYSAGEPLTLPKFRPEGGHQPEFLLAEHPNIPSRPFAIFPAHSTISGFDFNYNRNFASFGDVYIAEFGSLGNLTVGPSRAYPGVGHQVSRIDMNTGEVTTFLYNKSGLPAFIDQRGGFGRLSEVVFGPEGAMYIVDTGISNRRYPQYYVPNTGIIWRVSRT